jgi:hypothetical protein
LILPYLRTQLELRNDMRLRMRDPDATRWSDVEVYGAINDCLLTWHTRVSIPHLHTLSGGWVAGTAAYTLPAYIRGPIDPQQKRYSSHWIAASGLSAGEAATWVDIPAFTVEPDGTGGQSIRLDFNLATDEARIIWWMHNGPVPLTVPALNAQIDSDDTSLVLSTAVNDIEEAGYIKIDSEWLHYSGVSYGTSTTTLSNLIRAVNGTTAATHTSTTSVYWGVGCHRTDLYGQLFNHCRGYLHGLFLTDGAESEKTHHERQAMYYSDMATRFWRGYTPNRKTKLRLGHEGVGATGESIAGLYSWGAQR